MACISGYTNDVYYSYFDCCGNIQTGIGPLYQPVCADQALSGSAVGVYLDPLSACTEDCNTGSLSYNFTTNGNCGTFSAGTVTINVYGGSPGYTIDNVVPGSLSAKTFTSQVSYTGLTGGTYVFRINDSQGFQNNEVYFNVIISDCFETSLYNVNGTNCGQDNGSFTVSANTTVSPFKIVVNKDGLFHDLYDANTLPFLVSGLDNGIYDVLVYDYGFTTAKTENAVISASTGIDYGFWVVNAANCVTNTGKAAVTGTTGVGPYTYLWSDGQTSQLATGLTQGVYSVQVTDYYGCITEKEVLIGQALPLTVGLTTTVNPTCSVNNGSFTTTLVGGTAPFYYELNNGLNGYTLSNTFTVNNLNAGTYTVSIRDANFCPLDTIVYLVPQGGVYNVSNVVTNSQCNQNSGVILTTFNAPYAASYTLGLTGQTTNEIRNVNTPNQNYTFSNLPNDTYTLQILGQNNTCSYVDTVVVSSQEKFSVNISTTGATCGSPNGNAIVNVGTGYTNWDVNGVLDYVLSNGQQVFNIENTTLPYDNLSPGQYTLTVTDESNCSVTKSFLITDGGILNSVLLSNNCVLGNDGTASVIIFDGEPTFTYNWSPNVPIAQTGSTVSGLSGGSYYVTVLDSDGCTNYHNFTINCSTSLVTGQTTYDLCESNFITNYAVKRGINEMINEGYIDLTTGYTGCILNSVNLSCVITINGSAYTQTFIITNDTTWKQTIEIILSSIPEVGSYNVDLLNNKLTIKSNCSTGQIDPIGESEFKLELEVEYDISCLEDISQNICFDVEIDGFGGPYSCSYGHSGKFNGRPYYELRDSTCNNTLPVYVWWNQTNNRWELSQSYLGNPNYIRYIDYQGHYPISATQWSGSNTSFIINSSILGPCPTPGPTPTPSPTPTPTPTPTTVNFRWFNNGFFSYYSSDFSVCSATDCGLSIYTATPTITVGTILYYDSTLTNPVVGINVGAANGGFGRCYLSDDCPIVGSRYVAQVNGSGQVVNVYQC